MKTRDYLILASALALMALAGAAVMVPDLLVSALVDPTALVLAFGPLVRNLQAQRADAIKAMGEIVAKAEAEDRDLSADEQTTFDAHKSKVAGLEGRIARAQETELAEAGLDRGRQPTAGVDAQGRSVAVIANGRLSTHENVDSDPQRGFRSLGDYSQAVINAALGARQGRAMDPRLAPLVAPGGPQGAAPTTYGNEASGADGGFAIPPSYSTTIWSLSLEESALLPMTDGMPIEGNAMSLPKDETTPWGTNGVRAYWQNEASAATQTKPVLGRAEYKLKKLMALVPLSDELMADATALGAYLQPQMARSIRWKTDEAILFGTGAGQPLGAYNSGAAITVSKESGQTTLTLNATNVAKMVSRLMPGSFGRAIWLMNNDVLPALFTMTLGNYPIYMPAGAATGGLQGSPYGMLLGRPIVVTQHAKSFTSLGDVMLADLSYYQSITKASGIETASSMHLYFDADAVAFRATFRVDGQPKLAAAVSPANGSNTLSPFVQLEAR